MKYIKIVKICCFLFLISIYQNYSLAQYKIYRSVFGSGMGKIKYSTYTVNTAIGQTGIGLSSSTSNRCHFGFWYFGKVFVPIIKEPQNQLPTKFELFQNYPNPFNPVTVIRYSVPTLSEVQIEVFNVRGQKITTLVNTKKSPGFYEANFDAINLSSGYYFYHLKTKEFSEVKKMVVTK